MTLKFSLNPICIILMLIGFICLSCAEKKEQTLISQERFLKLARATNFNEIFAIEDTIQLEVSPASLIAYLGAVAIDQNGRIVVSDERLGQILMFSSSGRFLKLIAKKGSGPGEVERPYGVAFSRNGDLGVIDVGNNRINIYDAQGNFKRDFRSLTAHPSRIMFDSTGNIFVQDSGSPGRPAIQKYNPDGKLLNEFGQIPERIKRIGTVVRGGNFTQYKDSYIYYIHPVEYLIHQFTLDGKEIKTIKQKSGHFRPLKERLEKVDPPSLKKWKQSWDRAHSIFATNEKFLMTIYQTTKLSIDTVTNIIDLYDIEGNSIVENIPTSYLPVTVDDRGMIYCLNQELRLVQENPILFRCKIRE
ncbi:MAG: NHL repeat-containing protein [candidate division KSB1 bacterium]|nr:NHL repeat-containing protein [candidate division KSB1 bacterium]